MTQMGGMHTRVPSTLTNSHPIASKADAEAYIKRLDGVAPLMAQVIERLAAQEAMGIQPPRFVYALLIEPGVNLLQGAPLGGEGDSPTIGSASGRERGCQAVEISGVAVSLTQKKKKEN